MIPRLREKYEKEVAPAMKESRQYANVMQVPKVTKVVVNMGVKSGIDRDVLSALERDMATITGQKAVITKSRKAISNFKLREGMPVGIKVTLRGARMYEFLDRLVSASLPRIRDFRGISPKSFDGAGNYNLGIQEQTIFPEIDPDRIKVSHGMDIAICTTAKTDDEGRELLKRMGFPLADA